MSVLEDVGRREGNLIAIIITTKCISKYKYISILTKLDNSACLYCGIVSVLEYIGREGNSSTITITKKCISV